MNIRIGDRIGHWTRRAAETARLMIGVPDYARYREHMRSAHPDLPVLDEAAYVALMQQRRYGGAGGVPGKCPC